MALPDDELHSYDYPVAGNRYMAHPGKRLLHQWIRENLDEYWLADQKSPRRMPDGCTVLRSRCQIITEITDRLKNEGGFLKKPLKGGGWVKLDRRPARRKIACEFSRLKRHRRGAPPHSQHVRRKENENTVRRTVPQLSTQRQSTDASFRRTPPSRERRLVAAAPPVASVDEMAFKPIQPKARENWSLASVSWPLTTSNVASTHPTGPEIVPPVKPQAKLPSKQPPDKPPDKPSPSPKAQLAVNPEHTHDSFVLSAQVGPNPPMREPNIDDKPHMNRLPQSIPAPQLFTVKTPNQAFVEASHRRPNADQTIVTMGTISTEDETVEETVEEGTLSISANTVQRQDWPDEPVDVIDAQLEAPLAVIDGQIEAFDDHWDLDKDSTTGTGKTTASSQSVGFSSVDTATTRLSGPVEGRPLPAPSQLADVASGRNSSSSTHQSQSNQPPAMITMPTTKVLLFCSSFPALALGIVAGIFLLPGIFQEGSSSSVEVNTAPTFIPDALPLGMPTVFPSQDPPLTPTPIPTVEVTAGRTHWPTLATTQEPTPLFRPAPAVVASQKPLLPSMWPLALTPMPTFEAPTRRTQSPFEETTQAPTPLRSPQALHPTQKPLLETLWPTHHVINTHLVSQPDESDLVERVEISIRTKTPSSSFDEPKSPSSLALAWVLSDPFSLSLWDDENRVLQRFALATLWFSTDGLLKWDGHSGWLAPIDECDWTNFDFFGDVVECNSDHVVEGAVLGGETLSGSLPAELGLLTGLTTLNLASNQLTGSFPTELAKLTNLQTMFLFWTELTGSIPSSLCPTLEIAKIKCERIECDCCFGTMNQRCPSPSQILASSSPSLSQPPSLAPLSVSQLCLSDIQESQLFLEDPNCQLDPTCDSEFCLGISMLLEDSPLGICCSASDSCEDSRSFSASLDALLVMLAVQVVVSTFIVLSFLVGKGSHHLSDELLREKVHKICRITFVLSTAIGFYLSACVVLLVYANGAKQYSEALIEANCFTSPLGQIAVNRIERSFKVLVDFALVENSIYVVGSIVRAVFRRAKNNETDPCRFWCNLFALGVFDVPQLGVAVAGFLEASGLRSSFELLVASMGEEASNTESSMGACLLSNCLLNATHELAPSMSPTPFMVHG